MRARELINGTYISVSQQHLQTYLDEFEFRYNLRHQPHTMFDRLLLSFPRGAWSNRSGR